MALLLIERFTPAERSRFLTAPSLMSADPMVLAATETPPNSRAPAIMPTKRVTMVDL